MKLDIRAIRKSYGMNKNAFASIIGIKELSYSEYETRNELPSKYVYLLWKSLENFPIPDDFFYYTSFVLEINMCYHHLTQTQVAKMFDIANQSTISGYLKENIPMYEKKDYFLKFDPFIIPEILQTDSKEFKKEMITELIAKGNFILVEKRRQQKIKKDKERAKNAK